ncbi:restriction endonuclease subunit S [Leptolyngbya sp. PCC 6406]|uniref:restriction endonuclease subunit S n=1 Tax=Leptolyngbya sp. PCC 6406 TaxID=1173264 RepID=UPI0002AC5E72|nr:restriction endonuclease subunit S [Leptolyngbya sp. PCC 6406]
MSNYQLSTINYQLPKGYKQTEVGVIPEDWDVVELARLITSGPKNGYSGQVGEDAKGTPTLRLTATSSGYLIINNETVKHLDETIHQGSELFLQPGDVLIQRSNTYELVGTTAVFNGPPSIYVYPDLMMRLRFSNRLTAHWFWKYANSANGRRFFLSAAAGSTGSMPKISGAKLRQMLVPMPSTEEQRAIATTLSDVDALIAALDKLIAKQRHLKTATMQQLLTGKKRLPGFGEKWLRVELSELGSFSKGAGIRKDEVLDYGLPCIRYGEIYTRHHDFIREIYSFISPEVASQCQSLKKGDLLFTGSGETSEEIGKCVAFLDEKMTYAGGDIVIFSPQNQDSLFLGYLMNHESIVRQKARMGQGDAVVHIQAKNLARLQLCLPPLEEQRAIATVLSDMDAAISALETRRTKTQAIKQGMMQQLLTGKVRLLDEGIDN